MDRVGFDLDSARAALATVPPAAEPPPEATVPSTAPPPPGKAPVITRLAVPDAAVDAYLLVGTDTRRETPGGHADSVMLLLLPTDGTDPMLVSFPRNLLLPTPCGGASRKLKDVLAGCGEVVSGPELLALTLADYTGIDIDHFALVSLEGFRRVIDRLGGVTICVPHPVRDRTTGTGKLALPAGCTNADGTQATAWVTSRTTEELVNGRWRALPTTALDRDARQRQVLLQVLHKVRSVGSFADFGTLVSGLADAVSLDETLGFGDAVALAWRLRGLDGERLRFFGIPTRAATVAGEFVLLPTTPFAPLLLEHWPAASTWAVGAG